MFSIYLLLFFQREDIAKLMEGVPLESVISASGKVVERPPGQENKVTNLAEMRPIKINV